jgi:hypothetical protein
VLPAGDGLPEGLGDGLLAAGLGDGEAGDALTGVTFTCGDWLVSGVVEAA